MAIVSPENITTTTAVCTATLHALAESALQTKDMLAHNDAIRGLIAAGFNIIGSFAVVECAVCGEAVKVATHALVIDPLV